MVADSGIYTSKHNSCTATMWLRALHFSVPPDANEPQEFTTAVEQDVQGNIPNDESHVYEPYPDSRIYTSEHYSCTATTWVSAFHLSVPTDANEPLEFTAAMEQGNAPNDGSHVHESHPDSRIYTSEHNSCTARIWLSAYHLFQHLQMLMNHWNSLLQWNKTLPPMSMTTWLQGRSFLMNLTCQPNIMKEWKSI